MCLEVDCQHYSRITFVHKDFVHKGHTITSITKQSTSHLHFQDKHNRQSQQLLSCLPHIIVIGTRQISSQIPPSVDVGQTRKDLSIFLLVWHHHLDPMYHVKITRQQQKIQMDIDMLKQENIKCKSLICEKRTFPFRSLLISKVFP
jgi:hypothetical protein